MSELLPHTCGHLHGGLQVGQLCGRGQGHQTVRRTDRHVASEKLSAFPPVFARLPTAIDKMTRRTDLRIDDNAVLRKYLRGLAVVGHKPPAECDSMDTEYRDLYRDYSKYQESADPQHMFIIRSFLRRTRFMLKFLRFTLDGVFLARGPRLHPRTELQ